MCNNKLILILLRQVFNSSKKCMEKGQPASIPGTGVPGMENLSRESPDFVYGHNFGVPVGKYDARTTTPEKPKARHGDFLKNTGALSSSFSEESEQQPGMVETVKASGRGETVSLPITSHTAQIFMSGRNIIYHLLTLIHQYFSD